MDDKNSSPGYDGHSDGLSRQSTADTDLSHSGDILAQLQAENCLGCSWKRDSVLHEALTYCRMPGYKLPVSQDGWPALVIAVQRRDLDSATTLLEHGAEADCREEESGWTPLMFAASLGDMCMVKLLLEHGASVNEFAKPHDWNPLCCAIQANCKEVIGILLCAGADVDLIKKRHPCLAETYDCELGCYFDERCPCRCLM